jgi:hypothetical protein
MARLRDTSACHRQGGCGVLQLVLGSLGNQRPQDRPSQRLWMICSSRSNPYKVSSLEKKKRSVAIRIDYSLVFDGGQIPSTSTNVNWRRRALAALESCDRHLQFALIHLTSGLPCFITSGEAYSNGSIRTWQTTVARFAILLCAIFRQIDLRFGKTVP